MAEGVSRFLERISLPEEGLLWEYVKKQESLERASNLQILIIGTDQRLTLAKTVLNDLPDAQITIVESSGLAVSAAKKDVKAGEAIKIINGEFPGVMPEDDFRPGMVLAKNLIHFIRADKLADFVNAGIGLLREDGQTFYASTPFIVGGIVERRLRRQGVEFTRHSIGRGASVFEFRKKTQ